MEQTRKQMLNEMKQAMSTDIVPSGNTYSKVQSNVESNTITMNGITFRFRTINFLKEKDGIRIPHKVKQIICSPASSIQLLQDNSTIFESVNGIDNRVLTQFFSDSNKFGAEYAPNKILRYENEIDVDQNSGKTQDIIKVWYETDKNARYLYTFTYLHGNASGTYRLDFLPEGSKEGDKAQIEKEKKNV